MELTQSVLWLLTLKTGKLPDHRYLNTPDGKKVSSVIASINQFRQHPLDYIEGLETSVKGAIAGLPAEIVKAFQE